MTRAAFGIVVILLFSGCGSAPAPGIRSEFVPFTTEQRVGVEASKKREYRIQEGDILQIRFAYEKNLDQENVVVLSDGSISLVGVDRVVLAGRTMTEADSLVTLAYSKEYRDPDLSIIIQETHGRRVYVLGEVRNPGLYRLPMAGMDIMAAITLAGGFTADASRGGAAVVRVSEDGYLVQEVNLDGIAAAAFGDVAAARLQPYDIVYVPRSRSGDFAYFARSILMSIGYATRMVYDVKFIADPVPGGN